MAESLSLVEVEKREDGVAVILLNNPPLNLISLEVSRQLIEALADLDRDSSVRAVVIAGQGDKAFCAGADIKEFVKVRDQVIEKKLKQENEAMDRIAFLSKPVIAAIEGVALGGGSEICLACDLRVMSETAKIGFPEINLGVFPGSGGLFRLPGLVGPSKAIELMSLGSVVNASEAFATGLVNRVVPKGTAYQAACEMAEQIAQKSAAAIQAIKKGVRRSQYLPHDEMLRINLEFSDVVFNTKDCEEGIAAFFEKRKPGFNLNG